MRVHDIEDADINLIKGKKVAVVGDGSQGRAHARTLRESGGKGLVIALRKKSPSAKKAEAAKLAVMAVAEPTDWPGREARTR